MLSEDRSFDPLSEHLLHGLHEAGLYEFAREHGVLMNGIAPLQRPYDTIPSSDAPSSKIDDMEASADPTLAVMEPKFISPVEVEHAPFADLQGKGVPVDGSQISNIPPTTANQPLPPTPVGARRKLDEVSTDGGSPCGTAATGEVVITPSKAAKGKKPRVSRVSGADKGSKGLRHFAMKVCEKVKSKQKTSYNEVADELVVEFSNAELGVDAPNDEKNVRRRVYDALNVLKAMEIIANEKKDIIWKGLPSTSSTAPAVDSRQLQEDKAEIKNRVDSKQEQYQDLVRQHTSLVNLLARNAGKELGKGYEGIKLPFILLQTKPEARVDVEMSEGRDSVHIDFNNSQYLLHDDSHVLLQMGLHHPRADEGATVESTAQNLQHEAAPVASVSQQVKSGYEGVHGADNSWAKPRVLGETYAILPRGCSSCNSEGGIRGGTCSRTHFMPHFTPLMPIFCSVNR
ncbi:hypothetical protein CYMTET_33684 [Cymbomonas tetramitiformis]|uniref:Uncharacterized protein n=1 Tax=Cymbomonas tetramitiformis TaxID=36881 RepID=A0AAE0KQY3_9CHLO|nr:hypothetical protein CYMTET_33684 [Cymbomonas tetramitiformis]